MTIRQLTEPEQNELILRIYDAANRVVRRPSAHCTAEDRVHDLVADCLVALRAGTFDPDIKGLYKFVRTCARRQLIDRGMSEDAAAERDLEHLIEMERTPREWMDQSLLLEEKRLARYFDVIRASIDWVAFEAHRLVREESLSYTAAAERLHTSAAMVHKHVTAVQRAFRRTLFAVEIVPRAVSRGGRIRRPVRRRIRYRRRKPTGAPREIKAIPRHARTPTTAIREFWVVRLGRLLVRGGAC